MKKLLRWICDQAVADGRIEVATASGGRFVAGGGTGEPKITIRFMDKAAERALVLNPELALGELIMDGRLVVENGTMYEFLELIVRENAGGRGVLGSEFVRRMRLAAHRFTGRNSESRAQANVAHHYDLDHRLYDLFLDEDKNYSCAYFEHPGQSLEQAQLAKKRHVTAKLNLDPGQNVLDIGCGWGGLSLYLADVAGAGGVTGVTLSKEQHGMARARAEAQGLGDRVRIDLQDYRKVQGEFDRIVSVGMFEHVGRSNYREFFDTSARLLREDGVMLLHTIGWTGPPSPVNSWIAKYIFPGGHIPTLDEMLPHIHRAGLHVTDVEVLRLHYAETLRHWRERFLARREEAAQLYDERFCRMWEFYLAASEAGFRYDRMVVFQVQLARRPDAVPITRNYIEARERELRALEAGTRMPVSREVGRVRPSAANKEIKRPATERGQHPETRRSRSPSAAE